VVRILLFLRKFESISVLLSATEAITETLHVKGGSKKLMDLELLKMDSRDQNAPG
jgi:hypothetical protein